MKLLPAIDLLSGRAVRLEEGKRERATIYHERPVELVGELGEADRLHVVDLDGAFGEARQRELIAQIIKASPVPVEVGGGIRSRDTLETVLELGAAFIVLGTAAIRTPAFVEEACQAHPGKVIVAVDARHGIVAVDGWTHSGGITAIDLGRRAEGWGAAALLYTDVDRDGMVGGPNIDATAALARAVDCEVIASGGVASLDDLAKLRDIGIPAVVVGRALYDRRFTLAEAVRVARGGEPAPQA
jgi:phosphoribosylformimino-5-aminoimidazole carboxamide ribotide isomerase